MNALSNRLFGTRLARLVTGIGVLCVAAGRGTAQTETPRAPAPLNAGEVLQKTLATYTNAKSYQGRWSYTLEKTISGKDNTARGTIRMVMEIKAKGPTRLYYHLAAAPGQISLKEDPIPEITVVLDGQSAYLLNATDNEYSRVTLPKNAQWSWLLLIPQVPAVGNVQRVDNREQDGKVTHAILAQTTDGGATRMDVAAETYRIKRIVNEVVVGLVRNLSVISVEQETFNEEIPDSAFVFRAPRGAKEIAASPAAAAMFGSGK